MCVCTWAVTWPIKGLCTTLSLMALRKEDARLRRWATPTREVKVAVWIPGPQHNITPKKQTSLQKLFGTMSEEESVTCSNRTDISAYSLHSRLLFRFKRTRDTDDLVTNWSSINETISLFTKLKSILLCLRTWRWLWKSSMVSCVSSKTFRGSIPFHGLTITWLVPTLALS